jgi:hypothetical protein
MTMNPAQYAFSHAALYTDAVEYQLIHLPLSALTTGANLLAEIALPFCALIADKDEVTLLLPRAAWEKAASRFPDHRVADFPYRLITFDLSLNLDLIGFMALVSAILAEARVSILALSAFERDHIFVPAAHFSTAWDALKAAQTRL